MEVPTESQKETQKNRYFSKFMDYIPTWKELSLVINPGTTKDSDFIIDYFIRFLLFFTPFFIAENEVAIGILYRDAIIGIIVLIMALHSMYRSFRSGAHTHAYAYFALPVLFVIMSAQMVSGSTNITHTFFYLICAFVFLSAGNISGLWRYYLGLYAAGTTIVIAELYIYLFTGIPSLIGAQNLLTATDRLIPLLMVGIVAGLVLYLSEKNALWEKIYLAYTTAAMVIFFLYGDILAFTAVLMIVMLLQLIDVPTVRFIKKNMIALFLFGFCASNAPLLSYFNLKGINREFDLEYSIYVDIVIAIAGLVISGYWEKLPKEKDENGMVLTGFSKWYRRMLIVLPAAISFSLAFGQRLGFKPLSGFADAVMKQAGASDGEVIHVLEVYGIFGFCVLALLGYLAVSAFRDICKGKDISPMQKSRIIFLAMFILMSFLYPYSLYNISLFIFAGLSLPVSKKTAVSYALLTENFYFKLNGYLKYYIAVASGAALVILMSLTIFGIVSPSEGAQSIDSVVQEAANERIAMQYASGNSESAEGDLSETLFEIAAVESVEDISGDMVNNPGNNAGGADGKDSDSAYAGDNDEDGSSDNTDTESESITDSEENTDEADSEEALDSGNQLNNDIAAGISGGDYRIYDPNAHYESVNEMVRSVRGMVNLRDIPSIGDDSTIAARLNEGEAVTRTGIGENGWSRLEYGGQTLYAVSEYLTPDNDGTVQDEIADAEQEDENEDADSQAANDDGAEAAEQEADSSSTAKISQNSNASATNKSKASYTVQWSSDNKSCSIWSAGRLQGSMNVTDADGNAKAMIHYGDYYSGSGNNQKKYFYISVPQGDSELTINTDSGFVEAIKNMGYSGLYFNKNIHNW